MVDNEVGTLSSRVADISKRALAFARAIVLAAATPVELLRSLASSDLRQGFPKYYRSRLRVGVANVAIASMLARTRRARLISSLGLAAVSARLWWTSRSDWGSKVGLPPGRVGSGSRAVHDPQHFTEAAQRYGTVFKTNHFDEPAVCLMGMEDAASIFTEHADALEPMPLAFNRYVPGGLVRWKGGQEHADYRRLFQHVFGQHLVRSNEHVLESSIDRMLDKISTDNGSTGVRPILHIPNMVFEAWTQLFFGISPTDTDYREVAALYDTIDVTRLNNPDRMVEALQRLENMLDAKQTADTDCALEALRTRIGDPRLETAMVRNLIFTLDMTRTDISGLLTWALYHAATNGHVLDQLASEIRHGGDLYTTHSLVNRMVSETLRLEQSEHLFRRAGRDIEIGDYRAPAGWLVRVCTQESHRNAEVFADPDRYDPDRFLDPSWNAAEYAPFGIDGHSCIGEALTRRFTSVLLVRIARSYDVVVTNDGPLEMGEFQHWTPSDDFRIRLVSREADSPPNRR